MKIRRRRREMILKIVNEKKNSRSWKSDNHLQASKIDVLSIYGVCWSFIANSSYSNEHFSAAV